MMLASLNTFGQEVYNLDKPKTETELIGKAEKTQDKAIYKGIEYNVYKSAKGKLFFVYTNRNGNKSKKYVN